eukprot:339001-Pyramimonas_sp.AAC.1
MLIMCCPFAIQLQIVVYVVHYIRRSSPLSSYSLANIKITFPRKRLKIDNMQQNAIVPKRVSDDLVSV